MPQVQLLELLPLPGSHPSLEKEHGTMGSGLGACAEEPQRGKRPVNEQWETLLTSCVRFIFKENRRPLLFSVRPNGRCQQLVIIGVDLSWFW